MTESIVFFCPVCFRWLVSTMTTACTCGTFSTPDEWGKPGPFSSTAAACGVWRWVVGIRVLRSLLCSGHRIWVQCSETRDKKDCLYGLGLCLWLHWDWVQCRAVHAVVYGLTPFSFHNKVFCHPLLKKPHQYTHIHACAHAHIRTCMHTQAHTHTHTHTHRETNNQNKKHRMCAIRLIGTHTHICAHACMHTCTHIQMHTHAGAGAHIYACTCVHTCTCTHRHTCQKKTSFALISMQINWSSKTPFWEGIFQQYMFQ